jgi:4-carboxymuconolactone decarboxylase
MVAAHVTAAGTRNATEWPLFCTRPENNVASKKPSFYLLVKKQYPKYFAALEALGEAARNAGPLDEKTLHLVQLAAAAATRSEGSVHSHTRRALDAGATADEIRHALLAVTSTIGFPNVTAALSWAGDVLGDRKPRSRAKD